MVAVAVACGRLSANELLQRAIGAIVLSLSIFEVVRGSGNFERGRDGLGSNYVAHVLQAMRPNAIIIAPWVYGTPLAYAAYAVNELHGRNIVLKDLDASAFSFAKFWRRRRPVYVISEDAALQGFRFLEALHVNPDSVHDPKLFEQM